MEWGEIHGELTERLSGAKARIHVYSLRGAQAPLFHGTEGVSHGAQAPRFHGDAGKQQVPFGFAQGRLSTSPSLALRLDRNDRTLFEGSWRWQYANEIPRSA
jgi:hypothetical protein